MKMDCTGRSGLVHVLVHLFLQQDLLKKGEQRVIRLISPPLPLDCLKTVLPHLPTYALLQKKVAVIGGQWGVLQL